MAKASLVSYKLYRQGETGAIRARKPDTNVGGGTIERIAVFSRVNAGNKNAHDCSEKLEHEGIPEGQRGKPMRACLRSAGTRRWHEGARAAA